MRSSETTSSSFSKKGFGGFVSKVTILHYYLYIRKMVYKFLSSTSELHIIMLLTLYFCCLFFFIGYRLSVFQEELKTQVQAQVYVNFFYSCCCNDVTLKKMLVSWCSLNSWKSCTVCYTSICPLKLVIQLTQTWRSGKVTFSFLASKILMLVCL